MRAGEIAGKERQGMEQQGAGAVDDAQREHIEADADERAGGGESVGDRLREMGEDLASTRERLAETERRLGASQALMAALERRRALDAALLGAGAIDIESARLLAEAAMPQGEEADIGEVVDALRARKPHLFASVRVGRAAPVSSVMAGEVGAGDALAEAAKEARVSGDRRALLKYLRARRGG